jgi:hypothetical protein
MLFCGLNPSVNFVVDVGVFVFVAAGGTNTFFHAGCVAVTGTVFISLDICALCAG